MFGEDSCTAEAADGCFALIGLFSGALVDVCGQLTAYVSTAGALLKELYTT